MCVCEWKKEQQQHRVTAIDSTVDSIADDGNANMGVFNWTI